MHLAIGELPVELLLRVFEQLAPADLAAARLVCRAWSAAADARVWARSFSRRFGTGPVFASQTRSALWMAEYHGRVNALRQWLKGKAAAALYGLVNNEHGAVDAVCADFARNRLLTFSRAHGLVASCALLLGRSQLFAPGHSVFTAATAADAGWLHVAVGSAAGEVHVKSLAATALGRSLVARVGALASLVVGVRVNGAYDRHRARADVVAADADTVRCWTLGGVLVREARVPGPVRHLDTDFRTVVVVVTQTQLLVADFASLAVRRAYALPWLLAGAPADASVDFLGGVAVVCHGDAVCVFAYGLPGASEQQTPGASEPHTLHAPAGVVALGGAMQRSSRPRNPAVAGGDGLLYAATWLDGSVATLDVRAPRPAFLARIAPFADARAPHAVHHTKAAVSSVAVAVGAFADWVHIYDAHTGAYLRQGPRAARRLTQHGVVPILRIELAPEGQAGVVVSGSVVQHFQFGGAAPKRRPQPAHPRASLGRTIRAQLQDYNLQQHQALEAARTVARYNGSRFDEDEMSVALALSASYIDRAHASDDDMLEQALAQSVVEQ